jgi:hypothetical protein
MWVVVVLVVVVTAWLIVGGVSQNNSPPSPPPFDDGCAVCRRIWGWWDSLDFWGKLAGAAWYALQSIGCAIKGCRRP